MVYQFLNFTFDNQSLALQKEGADVDIRPYEAKLLAFLIENREKVVSKQEILTQVWQDKVVAEQVIFQNISHLRALFGSSAIKTFPKRGYQWQIDTLSFICEEKSLPQAESITINSQPEKLSSQHYFVLSIAVFTIFLFALFSFNIGDEKDLKVGVIPFESKGFELAADDIVTPTITYESVDDITAERFMTSAELVFTSLNNEFDVVVTGSTRTYKDKFYLDFIVKGPAEKWQGQIQGQSIEHVIQILNTHLSQQVIFELVTVEMSPEGKTAMLTLAHQNAPDDLIILAQLIEKMIDAQELDKAMVLSEKLAANAQAVGNQQQLGIAYTLQSNILTNKEVYALSREKLKMAIRDVTQNPVSHLIYSHAHVDHIGGAAIFGDKVQRIASKATAEKLIEAQDPRRPLVTKSFVKAVNMKVGDLEIDMQVAGKGHLDGNLFIFLPQHKILMNVDVIYPGWVPFTNLGMAEDVQGFIDQHDAILAYDFSVFVGGHLGRPGSKEDVLIAKEYVLDLIRFAQRGHEQANFYQAAQRVGWENKWLLVKSYMDDVTDVCSTNMLKVWSSRLGGAEVSTPGHCFIMQEHISINGLPLRTLNQVKSGDE